MIQNCPVCGKGFEILWPHLWAYKRNGQFLCSWGCLRESERKGDSDTNFINWIAEIEEKEREENRGTENISNSIYNGSLLLILSLLLLAL
jgi:hypothetical protein